MKRGFSGHFPRHSCAADEAAEAFTLIELLVVMAIIAILASLLLPTFVRSKRQAYHATCVSNLRQLGIGIRLYMNDHGGRFPLKMVADYAGDRYDGEKSDQWGLGGFDPFHEPDLGWYPRARARPLYNYMRPSQVYRCPLDTGLDMPAPCQGHPMTPSVFRVAGCSYVYNAGGLSRPGLERNTRRPQADFANGLAGKPEAWVPDPSRYILMVEAGGAAKFY